MIGVYLALAAAGILLILALQKPTLARLGTHHARQRPRQTALAIAGLMFGTIILGASAIAGDSTRVSFYEAVVRDYEANDLVAYNYQLSRGQDWSYFYPDAAKDIAPLVPDDPAAQGKVLAGTSALDVRVTGEDLESGLGDDETTVMGVDPATWAPIMGWQAETGTAPASLAAWPQDALMLDTRLADRWDAKVGDGIALYFDGGMVTRVVSQNHTGNLVLAAMDPAFGAALHAPDDVYEFDVDLTPPEGAEAKEITIWVTQDSDAGLVLRAFYVGGEDDATQASANTTGVPEPRVIFTPRSTFTFRITVDAATTATNLPFEVHAAMNYTAAGDPIIVDGTVGAILSKGGGSSNPWSGPAVVMPLPRLREILRQPGVTSFAAWDLTDDADAKAISDALQDRSSEGNSQYALWSFGAPRVELEENLAKIDLAMTAFFLGLGSFTMLAGLMLCFVLLALLIEERKSMLGTLRAIGAQRWDLTRLHAHEGAVYAILAAIVGLVGATILAALVASQMDAILREEEGSGFHLVLEPATVATSIGGGFVFTLVVITLAAYRGLRLHIPSAIRGEEAPMRQRRRALGYVLASLGLLLTMAGFALQDGLVPYRTMQVLGPGLFLLGAGSIAARYMDRNLAVASAAFGVVLYESLTFVFIDITDAETAILVPMRAAFIIIAAAILAAYSKAVHTAVVRALSVKPVAGAIAQNALGYLRHRPARAALTMAMLATVLAVMTALGTIFTTVAPVSAKADGGFPVVGDSPAEFGDAQQAYMDRPPRSGIDPFPSMERFIVARSMADGNTYLRLRGESLYNDQAIGADGRIGIGMTAILADTLTYEASELDPAYPDLRSALQAVSQRNDVVVLAEGMRGFDCPEQEGICKEIAPRVGDEVEYATGYSSDTVRLRVIALVKDLGTTAFFVHDDVLLPPAPNDDIAQYLNLEASAGTRLYAQPKEGVTPQQLQKELQAGFRPYSMDVYVVADVQSDEQYVFGVIQGLVSIFLALGILVGMVSLALISVRNVHVRKGEVGILRATGAQTRHILALFAAENLYVTLGAIVIGLGTGLLMAYNVLTIDEFVTFHIDWGTLALLYGATLLGAALAAAIPAYMASRIPPAKAVRYVE